MPMPYAAPDFELPGFDPFEEEIKQYRLSDAIEAGNAVFLFVYPFDFSPVCTGELCGLSQAEWYQFTENVEFWAISKDSVYAHRQFAEEYALTVPLLSDSHAEFAEKYNVCHETLKNHRKIPQRSIFVIDRDQQVRYEWTTENLMEIPDFSPVEEALSELCTGVLDKNSVPEVEIDYDQSGLDSMDISE